MAMIAAGNVPALTLNDRRVIELLFCERGLSRKELAERLNVTAASLTRIAGRLMEAGIVLEAVDRQGLLGQPRRPLSIAPQKFFAAGINFALTTIDVALIDLAGTVVAVRRGALDRPVPQRAAVAAKLLLDSMLSEAHVEHDALVGVGVSVPGNFSHASGNIRMHSLFPEFDDISLAKIFHDALGWDVVIENDGACAVLGEYFYGEGHKHRVFFKYHLGHGFRAGVIIDGRPFRGAYGNACVTGVLFPYGQPRPTGQDLIEMLAEAGMPMSDIADLDVPPPEAEPIIARWADRAAVQLEEAARIATGFFDPEVIVIGGRLPSFLNERLVARIDTASLPGPSRGLPVAPMRASRLGPSAGAIGAACALFFTRFFPGAIEVG